MYGLFYRKVHVKYLSHKMHLNNNLCTSYITSTVEGKESEIRRFVDVLLATLKARLLVNYLGGKVN